MLASNFVQAVQIVVIASFHKKGFEDGMDVRLMYRARSVIVSFETPYGFFVLIGQS